MRLRAPRRDEAPAVLAVTVAADVASIGRPDYTLQDVLDDYDLIETAFGEIAFDTPLPYATWRAEVEAKSDPAFRLALDDEAGPVAAAVGERWEGDVGYVAQLAVAARGRGHGHGRALLLALLNAFRDAGLTAAELSVAGANASATGLYESAGMTADFGSERWQLRSPARRTSANRAW
jgi:ribosomal protein S18 acetylase RimI-like enzyme